MDKDALKKIAECYIEVSIYSNTSSFEILQFLKMLKIQSIDYLTLFRSGGGFRSSRRFEESDFDLIKMAKNILQL